MMLKLYTQDYCLYCDMIKEKLSEWKIKYQEVNISDDKEGRRYLFEHGFKTVPQLLLNGFKLNPEDTTEFTEMYLYDKLDEFIAIHPSSEIAEILGRWNEPV